MSTEKRKQYLKDFIKKWRSENRQHISDWNKEYYRKKKGLNPKPEARKRLSELIEDRNKFLLKNKKTNGKKSDKRENKSLSKPLPYQPSIN